MIPEKKEFLKEVNQLKSEENKERLLKLYNHLLGAEKIQNVKEEIKLALEGIFPSQYTTDIMIPHNFLDTLIAKVLFSILFGELERERVYTISEVTELTKSDEKPNGYSKQYLGQEIKDKNLKAEKKNGQWAVYETNLNEYLITKGLPPVKK